MKSFLFAIILILAVILLELESGSNYFRFQGQSGFDRATKVIKHKTGDMLQNNDEIRTEENLRCL
jgi:hypothetical protein